MTRTVWILSLTAVTDEPRVRRQAQACMAKGWNVVVAGYPGRAAKPDGWTLLEIRPSDFPRPTPPGILNRMRTWLGPTPNILSRAVNLYMLLLRRGKMAAYLLLLPLSWHQNRAARAIYWRSSLYLEYLTFLDNKVREMTALRPDLIIANDYVTAPLAYALCEKYGCVYSVDIHEYAKGQFMHNIVWKILFRPWVDRMQKIYLPCAAVNTTVCDGIADLLELDYHPLPRPLVVRSTPFYTEMPFRKTGDRIKVLYHGIVYHTRGLGLAIDSIPLWRQEFDLIIRGPGSPEYFDELRARARKLGVEHRVTIEDPVLFNDIIPEANKCDIGYFVHEDISPQKRFTLPNKYFEYVMAGMALCVSDLPEMARITNQHDLGRMVRGFTPEAVAEVINSFTRDDIDRYKQNSLRAARELCWENESARMTETFEQLMQIQQKVAA